MLPVRVALVLGNKKANILFRQLLGSLAAYAHLLFLGPEYHFIHYTRLINTNILFL